jgi:hypothetical protein
VQSLLGSAALLAIGLFAAWFSATAALPALVAKHSGPISRGIVQLLTIGLIVICGIGILGWIVDIATPLTQAAFDVVGVVWLAVVFLGSFDGYARYLRLTGGR